MTSALDLLAASPKAQDLYARVSLADLPGHDRTGGAPLLGDRCPSPPQLALIGALAVD